MNSPTQDGRAQLWFRPYEPAPEEPDTQYPFWLCTGRVLEHWHSGSMTRRIEQLHQAVPTSYVEINRADATRLGVESGANVRITTRAGSAEVPIEVSDRMQAGHVSLPNGMGLDSKAQGGGLERAGVANNELTSGGDRDPFAGTPWHKYVPARIEVVDATA